MVDRGHHCGGAHRPARATLHSVLAQLEVLLGDCGNLAAHRRQRRMAQDRRRVGSAYPVPVEHLTGQIESPAAGVLVEIAQNVGQLQSPPKRLCNRVGGIARIAKDVDREMTDRACNPRAVKVERREIGSADICARVHLHPVNDRHEISPAQVVARRRLTKRVGDDMTRMSRIKIIDFLAPGGEGRNFVLDRLLAVGDVVDLSAKCIDRVHPIPAVLRQQPHGPIERGSGRLDSMPAVMQELGWKTSCGCPSCRPALNYYLLCAWPGEYRDDKQSRFINERVHANIQKDGTYSVVPRMWGGVTSAAELRAIAAVVDKFAIPTVKVTGGQRIDLLGVRKEHLPAVWADLNAAGLVSGAAYGKALRTVKTCVGKEWCRFGTQDSTRLGVKLERLLCGSWTPAKVKLAVSGCPRNCAEATVKDIGVICVDSGYDIHIAGAAGLHVRATDLLGHVETEEAALEHVAAVMQLYREEAAYHDRLYKWVEKVGLERVRQVIMEDHEAREALYERFLVSQRAVRKDPWAERAAGFGAKEFTPLAVVAPIEAPVEMPVAAE